MINSIRFAKLKNYLGLRSVDGRGDICVLYFSHPQMQFLLTNVFRLLPTQNCFPINIYFLISILLLMILSKTFDPRCLYVQEWDNWQNTTTLHLWFEGCTKVQIQSLHSLPAVHAGLYSFHGVGGRSPKIQRRTSRVQNLFRKKKLRLVLRICF